MFSIKINRVIEVGDNLERVLRSLNQEICELESVIRNLARFSCMEEVRYQLRRKLQKMNDEKNNLTQLIKCLDKIVLYYSSCENRIQDYAEQEVIYYQRRDIGVNDLRNVSAMLQNMI